jgi:AraC family transcriptional regulator
MMEQRIEKISGKIFAGLRMRMSVSKNKTGELWHGFMVRRKEIINTAGPEFYSVQIYDPDYFNEYNPELEFEKWAAIEVTNRMNVPEGMEILEIPGGLYAVFLYKGAANDGDKAFRYIFATWLPKSGYKLDDRPHFEILGEKFRKDDPDSEEEIWIPVK